MKKSPAKPIRPLLVGTHPGPREYQEDCYGVWGKDNRVLLVVADGMGGHSRGDLASRWLVDHLSRAFEQETNVEAMFVVGVEKTVQRMQESGKDMGCTFAAALLEKKNEAYELSYTWLGDTRVYLSTKSPRQPSDNAKKIVEQEGLSLWILTGDDSFTWSFYINGEIDIDQVTRHPHKNQLEFSLHPGQPNAVDIIKKRIRTVPLNEGDKLFICTDGTWETYLAQADILNDMNNACREKTFSLHLRNAMKNGLLKDNATFILAEIDSDLFDQLNFHLKRFKRKKKRIGPVLMIIAVILIFVVVFLALVGELSSFIETIKQVFLDIAAKVERFL